MSKPFLPLSLEETSRRARDVLHTDLKDIPSFSIEATVDSRLVVKINPQGPASDRFRYLRNALKQQRSLGKLKSISIVSSLPHDGKSTVAMNLATALAESGRDSVLCIEGDLYNPTIANSLSYVGSVGLAECISDNIDPLSAVVKINPLGWYLLTAGVKRNNPNEVLQADAIGGLLRRLEKHFDWIVLDTPPLAPLRDTVGVIGQTDGTLLVVRAGQTPQNHVDESLRLIGKKHAIGIVLNAASEMNDSYGKYYGSYYRIS